MTFKHLLQSSALIFALSACSSDPDIPTPEPEPEPTPAQKGILPVKVIEFMPAPGQFVNEIPAYEDGDTQETILAKAQDMLDNGQLLSLGAFGGYITLKLYNPILALAIETSDLRILGNAYLTSTADDTDPLGSSEPGVVMIMPDNNNNGLPDEQWYVIAGDHWEQAVLTTVTYTDNSAAGSDAQFVAWADDLGNSGYISRNRMFHNHPFFPMWLPDKQMTFTAFRLPDNGFFDPAKKIYRQHSYKGYADSWPNNAPESALSIVNAVPYPSTSAIPGQTVSEITAHAQASSDAKVPPITRIDFIRIYTGVLQNNGPIGEVSTEISAVEALH